jgi:hypothetical protein
VWCSLLAMDPSLLGISFADAEWWMFLGGICGAMYVVQSILTAPILGMAIFVIAGMIGQLSTALLVDTFGLFNSTAVPATPLRLGGVGLVFAGAVVFCLIIFPKRPRTRAKLRWSQLYRMRWRCTKTYTPSDATPRSRSWAAVPRAL